MKRKQTVAFAQPTAPARAVSAASKFFTQFQQNPTLRSNVTNKQSGVKHSKRASAIARNERAAARAARQHAARVRKEWHDQYVRIPAQRQVQNQTAHYLATRGNMAKVVTKNLHRKEAAKYLNDAGTYAKMYARIPSDIAKKNHAKDMKDPLRSSLPAL